MAKGRTSGGVADTPGNFFKTWIRDRRSAPGRV